MDRFVHFKITVICIHLQVILLFCYCVYTPLLIYILTDVHIYKNGHIYNILVVCSDQDGFKKRGN